MKKNEEKRDFFVEMTYAKVNADYRTAIWPCQPHFALFSSFSADFSRFFVFEFENYEAESIILAKLQKIAGHFL